MKKFSVIFNHESFDKLDLPIFIKNTDGIYVYCNQAFINFLGISKNKILGHTAYDIAPKALADMYVAADKELLDSAQEQSYKSKVQTKEAETRVIFNKSVLYTPEHNIAGFIGAIDATSLAKTSHSDNVKRLTPREGEVLRMLAQGKSVKAIASSLGISAHTVTHYLKAIYHKLDAHSKNEAVFKALTLLSMPPN